MRLIKFSDAGAPALVFIAAECGLLHIWIGPLGLHIGWMHVRTDYCARWREHPAGVVS